MLKRMRPRVLVVDNYEAAADTLTLLVQLWGYDGEVCYDGPSALELALTYLPQIVLLDVGLPGLDGFQVALALRSRPELANLVIIGITGHANESHRLRALAEGFDFYLVKPVDSDELLELLAQASPQAEFVSSRGANRLMGVLS